MSNQVKLFYYLILNHYSKILKCPFSYILMLTNLKPLSTTKQMKIFCQKRKQSFWKLRVYIWMSSPHFCQGVKNPRAPTLAVRCPLQRALRVTPGGLSGWQKQGPQTPRTHPRTPRRHSPSLSSVGARSWSCVFLCFFYVSLSEEPPVSDEHLSTHELQGEVKVKLLTWESALDGTFNIKAELLSCLTDIQID